MLLVLLRRPKTSLCFRKSWHGEPERHSEAARKGWRKRRWRDASLPIPRLLQTATLGQAVAWYERNLGGRTMPTRYGINVYCPRGIGPHLATATVDGKRRFSRRRAQRLSWIEPTIRKGRCFVQRARRRRDKGKYVLLAFFVGTGADGEDYVVVVRSARRHFVLITAFPADDPEYVERLIRGQKEVEPP